MSARIGLPAHFPAHLLARLRTRTVTRTDARTLDAAAARIVGGQELDAITTARLWELAHEHLQEDLKR